MFGQLMRATTSLIPVTSANLYQTSSEKSISSVSSFGSAVKSVAEAGIQFTTGATQLTLAGAAIGTGIVTAGGLVGGTYTLTGLLGMTNWVLGSATIAAVKHGLTEATVTVLRNSTATVSGTGVLHTLLNGQMIIDGFKNIASSAVKVGQASGQVLNGISDGIKAGSYAVAGTGLKAVESLANYAGSDQDGFGNDQVATLLTKSINLAQNDAELGQNIEKLYEDQAALNKTILVVNETIAKLQGDNEITQAVKANQQIIRNTLVKQQADLEMREESLAHEEAILESWNLMEAPKADLTSSEIYMMAKNAIELDMPEIKIAGDSEFHDIPVWGSAIAA